MMLLIAFAIPLLIGIEITLLVSKKLRNFPIFIWVAPAFGIGFSSTLFFIWSLLFSPGYHTEIFLAIEIAVALLLVPFSYRSLPLFRKNPITLKSSPAVLFLFATGIVALLFFVARFLIFSFENPIGSWDAWTIWNSRARFFLFGDANTWKNVFSEHVNHSDYPMLVSSFVGRCWVILKDDRAVVPLITAGLFTFSTIGLLSFSVKTFRTTSLGLITAIILLSLPTFVWSGASQYADIPLSLFFLAVSVFMYFWCSTGDPLTVWLAGIFAGLALWTKNEGISFALSTLVSLIFFAWRSRRSISQTASDLGKFLGGASVFLVLLWIMKRFLAPSTDLFEFRNVSDYLNDITNLERYWVIIYSFGEMMMIWGAWKLPFFPVMTVYTFLMGKRPLTAKESLAWQTNLTLLLLTIAQYFVIYLITPHELAWHISTSLGRLINQLLPSIFLSLFFILKDPFLLQTKKDDPDVNPVPKV